MQSTSRNTSTSAPRSSAARAPRLRASGERQARRGVVGTSTTWGASPSTAGTPRDAQGRPSRRPPSAGRARAPRRGRGAGVAGGRDGRARWSRRRPLDDAPAHAESWRDRSRSDGDAATSSTTAAKRDAARPSHQSSHALAVQARRPGRAPSASSASCEVGHHDGGPAALRRARPPSRAARRRAAAAGTTTAGRRSAATSASDTLAGVRDDDVGVAGSRPTGRPPTSPAPPRTVHCQPGTTAASPAAPCSVSRSPPLPAARRPVGRRRGCGAARRPRSGRPPPMRTSRCRTSSGRPGVMSGPSRPRRPARPPRGPSSAGRP